MIGKIFRAVWECFCGKSKSSKDKKQDTFQSNDNLDDMEAGGKGEEDWGDDFESWDNKPVAPQIVPKPLQKLDDFDGMAAPPKENK